MSKDEWTDGLHSRPAHLLQNTAKPTTTVLFVKHRKCWFKKTSVKNAMTAVVKAAFIFAQQFIFPTSQQIFQDVAMLLYGRQKLEILM